MERALSYPGPAIIEAVVDPFEPPMPPKISVEQATLLAEALAKGEPNRAKIAMTILADKIKELV
jgi:pyruvate dehydrogenase (quinone)